MSIHLGYRSVCKLTLVSQGQAGFTFVAMAFKVTPTVLPDGTPGVSVRYIVNSPDRFEHRFDAKVLADSPEETILARVSSPDSEEPPLYYNFEPLTLDNWKTMEVWDGEALAKELTSDEMLRNYYWNDWVPSYWTEASE